MPELTTLLLKLPRGTEVTPEAAQTFLSTLTGLNTVSFFQKLTGVQPQPLALEIILANQQIGFYITCDSDLAGFVETQIQSAYPLVIIEKVPDPLAGKQLGIKHIKPVNGSYYPINTYSAFQEVDPISSLLSILGKSTPDEVSVIQYAVSGAGSKWQSNALAYAEHGTKNEDGTYSPRSDATVIKEKTAHPGLRVTIRIASTRGETVNELTHSFNVFARQDGNSLKPTKVGKLKAKRELSDLLGRVNSQKDVLNIAELATLWHLPSDKIKAPSITWGNSVLSEPPQNLPVATPEMTDEDKSGMNFFAKALFNNKETIFGIKQVDRRRHVWTIGKTGTGKSTMIANMAIDDLKKGRGVAIIDPHGDLVETVLDYVPKSRINDVVYFNPADKDFPIHLNPLEVLNREEAELVVSGLMAIFTKVWANVWSARMEYILRNAFMTLSEVDGTTLEDVLKLLSDSKYRKNLLGKIKDESLIQYWTTEFEQMPPALQKEAISPIQNKVGQFVTSPLIRRIIGKPKSSISIDDIMNDGKILLVNLSQGRLGEDNSSLLGAMLITKMQLAAMHRVEIKEENRRDFYLYVDEFQNFATDSFIKILSEARKYRLNINLANQFMAQIPEHVRKAILGNAGSIISFTVGAEDASMLHKEFSEVFSDNDLVNLANYQIAIKLMIDGHSSRPFLAHTLPLPASVNQNKDKVIAVSRERWAKKA